MDSTTQASWLERFLGKLRQGRATREAASELYCGIVQRAREPALYREHGVPDTSDGRLELIGLFAAPVMRRLREDERKGVEVAQALFDLMFADVDRSFREQGVGDLSVGKHVKRAAATFLARAASLDHALEAGDSGELARTIARNLDTKETMCGVAETVMAFDRQLARHPLSELMGGSLPPETQLESQRD